MLVILGTAMTGCSSGPATTAAATAPATRRAPSTPSPSPTPISLADESAVHVLTAAQRAVADQSWVHVRGTVDLKGDSELHVDVVLGRAHGGEATGTLTVNHHRMMVRRVGSLCFEKGDAAFWRDVYHEPSAQAAAQANRWAEWRSPGTNTYFTLLTFRQLTLEGVRHTAADRARLEVMPGTPLGDGSKSVGLDVYGIEKDGPGSWGEVFIRATGLPLPAIAASTSTGELKYSGWDTPVKITAPSGAVQM